MRNSGWIEERDQNRGLLFCLASCVASQLVLLAGRASDGCFPTRQNSLCLSSKQAFPQLYVCSYVFDGLKLPLKCTALYAFENILLFHVCSCDTFTYSCLCLVYRQWLLGDLEFLHLKALRLTSGGLFLSSFPWPQLSRHLMMFKSV